MVVSVLSFRAPPRITPDSACAAARARGQTSGTTLPAAYTSDGSRQNQPTMDGARGALLPIAAAFRLRATQARYDGSAMSWRSRCKCQQKQSDGASLQDEVACPDCPMTNKPARNAFAGANRIVHHIQRQYLLSVLPLLVVDNSINLCKYTAGWFVRHGAVRTGHLILK